jgi:hypothetical protein
MMNYYKKISLLAIVVIIILSIGGLLFMINKDQQNIELVVVPSDAIVEFKNRNGSIIKKKGSGSFFIEQGDYDVSAKKEGFLQENEQLSVADEKRIVILTLEPESQEALKWAEKNNKQYLEAEGKAGNLDQISGEKFRAENPIISSLPYNSGFYRIDYGKDRKNNNSFKLVITADTPQKRQVALEKIREFGYNPSDFIIEFKGVGNIFLKDSL